MGLKIKVRGGRRVERLAAKLAEGIPQRPIVQKTVEIGLLWAKRRIRTLKKDPSRVSWQPWSRDYRETRDLTRHSLGIDTGLMLASGQTKATARRGTIRYPRVRYAGFFNRRRPFLGYGRDGSLDDTREGVTMLLWGAFKP